jgi:hypothetical protein
MAITGAVMCAAVGLGQQGARAGHESPFYPSFYPQEIRIETLDPAAAVAGWPKPRVHAYVGEDLFVGGPVPSDAVPVESLHSYVVLSFDAPAGRYVGANADAQMRCATADRTLRAFARDAGYVFHPYPVTPYHADYLEQFDLARRAQERYARDAPVAGDVGMKIRAKGPLAEKLVPASARAGPDAWDATLEEIDVAELAGREAGGSGGWPRAPWVKQGWYQASRLYAGSTENGAKTIYDRLVSGRYRDPTERINLERALVSALVASCKRVIVGYTLKREYLNADYSNGVENAAFDSQAGLLSPLFPRTVKLKDFPWNGWLRLGIAAAPTAAWNPVGGLDDDFGQLLWQALGDPALLPEPYGGSWIANRASVAADAGSGVVAIPADALCPEAGTGFLRRVGEGKTARQRLRYAVVTSAFHDGTATGVADILYPYIFAFRWGTERRANAGSFDPIVARSTVLMREWLAGFKVIGVKTQTQDYGGDLKFSYRVPVVDVYLRRRSSDPEEAATIAPPWSTLPWEVIVLMEEAVQRGMAAFSASEARRRSVPWLDLVRDRQTGERLAALVDKFRAQAYRPAALRGLVTAEEAQQRWTALGHFYAQYGHFLVTNGPYRLESWSADSVALQVFRDTSYPRGVGSFDAYAIPLKAYASSIEDRGDRLEIRADVERVIRSPRSYEIERVALAPESEGAMNDDRPECRYVIVGPRGTVVRVGKGSFGKDGRSVLRLDHLSGPAMYTVVIALLVEGNSVNPEVRVIEHSVAGRSGLRQSARADQTVVQEPR